jgi:hypothetical protein
MSDLKATWLGRIEHGNIAAKTNMNCHLWLSTEPANVSYQDENGGTPSHSTAKTGHEETTTAILVFCARVMQE